MYTYVHSMAECIKAQIESNNAKDEEGCIMINGAVDNMEK